MYIAAPMQEIRKVGLYIIQVSTLRKKAYMIFDILQESFMLCLQ